MNANCWAGVIVIRVVIETFDDFKVLLEWKLLYPFWWSDDFDVCWKMVLRCCTQKVYHLHFNQYQHFPFAVNLVQKLATLLWPEVQMSKGMYVVLEISSSNSCPTLSCGSVSRLAVTLCCFQLLYVSGCIKKMSCYGSCVRDTYHTFSSYNIDCLGYKPF